MSLSKLSKPPHLPLDLQDTVSWARKVIHEDLYCGEKIQISDGHTRLVLNECSVVMCEHMNVKVLVKYLMKRGLLTDTEVWTLNQPKPPKESAVDLLQILARKGVNGFDEFYVCLLESYMMEGGVDGHYAIIKTIQKEVRCHCGIKPGFHELNALSIGNKIKVISIPVNQAQRLLQRLNIGEVCDILANNPTTLNVYYFWLSAKQNPDWRELVEAFLIEQGLGYCVSGMQPVGSSNPPVVCNYVRSLRSEWVLFAQHIGFPNCLIEEIQSTYGYNCLAQIQAFLRECLIPDCGDERTKIIMLRVKQVMKIPTGSPSRIPVPKRLLSNPKHSALSRPQACEYTPSPKTEKKVYDFTTQQHSSSIPQSRCQLKHRTKLSGQATVFEEPSSSSNCGMQTHDSGSLHKHSPQTRKRVSTIGLQSRIPLLNHPLSDPQHSRSSSPSKLHACAYTPSPNTEKKIYDFTTQQRSSAIPHSHFQLKHRTMLSRQTTVVEDRSSTPKWRMHTCSLPSSSSLHKDSSQTPKRANMLAAMRSNDSLQGRNNPLTICGSTISNRPISDIVEKFQELSSCAELNWCSLARSLFLTLEEIDQISKCFGEEEGCYQMLCYWNIRFYERANYSTLARALVNSNQEDIIANYPHIFRDNV